MSKHAVRCRDLSLVFAAVMLAPSAAWAASPTLPSTNVGDDAPPAARESKTERTQKVLTGGIDVGIFADRQATQDVVSISPLVELGLRPRPEVELGISMGAAALVADDQVEGRVRETRPSNLVVGTRWVRDEEPRRFRGYAGFEFALPTNVHLDDREVEALDLALGTRAGLDPWQWRPATMGLVAPIGWSAHARRVRAGLDGAFGGLFSAAGNPDTPGLAAQLVAHVAYTGTFLTAGAHASAVWNGRDERNGSQFAVGPLAKLGLCFGERRGPSCPIALAGRVNFNLDAPYGFAGDGLDIWGVQLGLQWSLREAK